MKEQAFKAFVQGFILMLIGIVIFIAVVNPDIGFAQEGNRNPNNVGVESPESSDLLYTDDPLGRVIIPIEEEETVPLTNNGVAAGSPLTSAEREGGGNGNVSSEPPADGASRGVESAYSSPLVIPGADFRSDGFDPDSTFFSFGSGYARGENVNSCMMAPAYVPNGATIEEVYASVYDNDATSGVNIWVKLYRVSNYSGAVDTMANMETMSESSSVQVMSDTSISYPNVQYPDYSYYVGVCLESSDTRLYSVRIYY